PVLQRPKKLTHADTARHATPSSLRQPLGWLRRSAPAMTVDAQRRWARRDTPLPTLAWKHQNGLIEK
ncbi:hypothetical protein, partial [Bradyrhizobium sp.]|uniref:hypothetical protein n=1 Tax=Bradyrhizobium sp. TaxID=376 RepID=UPI00391C5B02